MNYSNNNNILAHFTKRCSSEGPCIMTILKTELRECRFCDYFKMRTVLI